MFQQADIKMLYENAANHASQQIANAIARHHQLKTYDSVKRAASQAVRDAAAGYQDAVDWLDVCAPDWREDGTLYELHDLIGMHAVGVEF